MTHFLSLFSGIGGFDLAAYKCGLRFDRHFYSEIDPYAIKVFQMRFPDAEPLGDITKITQEDLPDGEYIIAGGFPCQDISCAGKGAGLAGARSGLWFEMLRIIGMVRPRFVVVENVAALLARGIDTVLGSLAEIGYDAEWQIISAQSVGAPHRRERVYLIAYPSCNDSYSWRPESAGFIGKAGVTDGGDDVAYPANMQCNGGNHHAGISVGQKKIPKSRNDGWTENVADSQSTRARNERENFRAPSGEVNPSYNTGSSCGGLDRQEHGENVAHSNEGRLQKPEFKPLQERTRGRASQWPCFAGGGWWATEPDVGRVANGIPSRVDRLKCLGNAIVPQCAEVIFNLPAFDEWRL